MLRRFAVLLVCGGLLACGKDEPEASGKAASSSEATRPGDPADKSAPEPVDRVDGYEVIHAKTKGGDSAEIKVQAPPGWTIIKPPTEPDPHAGKFSLEEALEGLPSKGRLVARIKTDLGTLECTLFEERTPHTVANFVGLARGRRAFYHIHEGAWVKRPLYDGSTFHRVIPEFMIQGGDYLGNGSGRTGFMIPDEVVPTLVHDRAGQLCMANRGPNTNEAQFFVTDGPAPHLDGSYTIFGQCVPSAVVYQIARVPQSGPPLNQPLTPVKIASVSIERVTTAAPADVPAPGPVPAGRAVHVAP